MKRSEDLLEPAAWDGRIVERYFPHDRRSIRRATNAVKNMNLVAERFEIVSQIPGVGCDPGALCQRQVETVDHYFHKLLTTFPAVSAKRFTMGTKIAREASTRHAISKSARSVIEIACCQAGDHPRSHFFCSFHALMLKKALEDRIEALMIDLRP